MVKLKSKKLLWVLIPILAVLLVGAVLLLVLSDGSYTVSFYDTDGTLLSSEQYAKGENLVLPQDPVKEGSVFTGWILKGEEKVYDFTAEHALVVRGNMVFTASFGMGEYVVTFLDANGIDVISSHTYQYNEEITVPDDPQKTGYTFIGWVRHGDPTAYDFHAEGAKKVKGEMVFVALFEGDPHQIVFKDADGNEYRTYALRYGDYFVAPEAPAREGYAFDGWALDGEENVYDFTAQNAARVTDKDLVFVPLYTKRTTVTGKLVRLDGSAYTGEVTLCFGETEETVTAGKNGVFSVQVRPGQYTFKLKSTVYRCLPETVTIKGDTKNLGTVTMLQALQKDYTWWNGAQMTERGISATISTAADAHAESATEYKLGNNIMSASSWNIKSHIASGANGRVGFSFGMDNGKNGTVFFYVDMNEGTAGFFTWSTNKETAMNANRYSQKLSNGVLEMLNSANGYDLELKASNIKGAGTGWLTLYVNGTQVLRVYNNFVGVSSGGKGVNGQVMNLSNVHLSLAVMGRDAKAVFQNYMHQCNGVKAIPEAQVSGKLVKLDQTALTDQATLQCGSIYRTVRVAKDGSFTVRLPEGNHAISIAMSGYWGAVKDIPVTGEACNMGTVTLLQNLTKDYVWWDGASMQKDGSTVTISTASGVHAESATEYKIGNSFKYASSWTVTSHIKEDASGIIGFSVGRDDGKNGTVFIYVNTANGKVGFFTWSTFQYLSEVPGLSIWTNKGSGETSKEIETLLKSGQAFDLTLMATDIDAEGTGLLTLYVNDTPVLAMEASEFEGVLSGGKGVNGQKMDLANGHLSLVVMGAEARATFEDYYYILSAEKGLKFGTVTGTCEKVDGTSGLPETIILRSGAIRQEISVAADGTFSASVPVGTYTLTGTLDGYTVVAGEVKVTDGKITQVTAKLLQNLVQDYKWWDGATKTENGASVTLSTSDGAHSESATEYRVGKPMTSADSWRISSYIDTGATGIVGFSVGRNDGKNGTVFVYVNTANGKVGFFTWSTFQYFGEVPGFDIWTNKGSGETSKEIETLLKSGESFDLTLTATNIDGEGTGWLTLYVNETAVLTMYNNFVGVESGGKGVNGQRMDLGNAHLSIAAMGTNISATFTDYYYTVNSEMARKVGTVSGKLEKLDGTALPDTALLQFGDEYRYVKVAADGTFHTQLSEGTYTLVYASNGYKAVCDDFSVDDGQSTAVTVKLLQTLTQDHVWRGGATKTESGSSVTLSTASGVNVHSGTEYKIGNSLDSATEWTAETYIEAGATGLVGFTVGRDDGNNGTIFFYIDKAASTAGFFTWGTFKYTGSLTVRGDTSGSFTNLYSKGFTVSDAVKAALNSRYKLTLKATGVSAEGTGTLILYVNDMECLRMDTSGFTGVLASGTDGVTGQKPDLANAHLSIAVKGANIGATFTDYFYKVND